MTDTIVVGGPVTYEIHDLDYAVKRAAAACGVTPAKLKATGRIVCEQINQPAPNPAWPLCLMQACALGYLARTYVLAKKARLVNRKTVDAELREAESAAYEGWFELLAEHAASVPSLTWLRTTTESYIRTYRAALDQAAAQKENRS
jgi:hypothetical protein